MPLLSVQNLGRRVSSKWLLREVSFDLKPGEAISVFGASGAGKSVLTRVLAGIEHLDRGTISFDLALDDPRLSISAALQNPGLADELSVYENLIFFAEISGVVPKMCSRRVAQMLELLQISDLRTLRPSQLSRTALYRVEIARALLPDSAVYIIDSLLDTMEPSVVERVWEYLLNLRREQGTALILVTGLGKVAQMCSRVIVLVGGLAGYDGSPDAFCKMAGEDIVVVGDIKNPYIKDKIKQQFIVTVSEEDGFLSFKTGNGDKTVADLLSEFGADMGCVYLKRPTLEDALEISAAEIHTLAADIREGIDQ